jgi:hypothetical protein
VCPAARRWFGGDIALLYAALGQKVTTKVERSFLVPRDPVRFASLVFEALGGEPLDRKIVVSSPEEGREQARAQDRHHKLRRLSGESLRYVQLQEALGVPPTQKDFGRRVLVRRQPNAPTRTRGATSAGRGSACSIARRTRTRVSGGKELMQMGPTIDQLRKHLPITGRAKPVATVR